MFYTYICVFLIEITVCVFLTNVIYFSSFCLAVYFIKETYGCVDKMKQN